MVIAFERRGKVLDGRIAQILGDGGDALCGIGEQDHSGGHAGLRLFLKKGFLAGHLGLNISMAKSMGSFLKYVVAIDSRNKKNR